MPDEKSTAAEQDPNSQKKKNSAKSGPAEFEGA